MSEADWTTEEAIAHGREWLAVGWAWKRGQVSVLPDGRRPVVTLVSVVSGLPLSAETRTMIGAAPDMRDPGTRGHALAQVRAARDNPDLSPCLRCTGAGSRDSPMAPPGAEVHADGGWARYEWAVMDRSCHAVAGIQHDTESDALLAARRAAP